MVIFSWIVLSICAFLLVCSGICWLVYMTKEDSDWRRLAVKVFRQAMVFLLLQVNVWIYGRLFRDF